MVATATGRPVERATRSASDDGECVRAEVQRHADRRNAVGEQLDEASGHAGEVATVEHLVVADRFRAFHLDALAVREYAVERLQRQTGASRAGPRAR